MVPYNGVRCGLISCDVLVTSEAGVKLYGGRLTETLPKIKRHHLVSAGKIMPASYRYLL